MKRTNLILALLMAVATSISADNLSKNPAAANQARTYFQEMLAGKRPAAPVFKDKAANLALDSATVWHIWQQVVQAETDGTLGNPVDIASADPRTWAIADTLEPNNVAVNYYYITKGEKPAAGYPLYIYLHGSGPRQQEWSTGLKLAQMFKDAPSLYFIPQIPQEGEWYRWYQVSKQWFIEKTLRQSMALGHANPRKLYIFGISEGGYGSQRLASFYADYLAAAGPMAGGEPLKNAPAENLSNTAFSLLTGDKDAGFYRNMLTQGTKDALDSLQTLFPNEFPHNVKLLEGYGHGINYGLMTPWLSQYERNPYPTHFIWEDYEMHGRHRSGFYNIAVDKRPFDDPNKRTRYDVSIKDNVVSITMQDITYTCTEKDPHWGIELKFARSYAPSTSGQFTIFLNNQLANLKKPVTVVLNGKTLYKGKVQPSASARLKSLATFGDPLRIFPAAITIDVK